MSTNETILIVDDSRDNLLVMKKVLQKALPDVTVVTCQHSDKALALLRDTDVALALLDVQMPDIDGLELCKRIKSNADTQSVSVILITSHGAEPKMKARGLELGADDFITRPIDNAELTARVQVALRIHRSEAALRHTASDALRRFETMVSCSRDMMAMLDRDYVYLAVNDVYASACGKAREDFEGHSVAQVLGEDVFEAIIRPHVERCLTGEDVHYSNWFNFPATGRRFMDISYSPYKDNHMEVAGFVVTARDSTERKVTEDSLAASEQKSHAWLAHSPVCTKILDLDFNLQYMSASGVKDLKIDDITQYYGKPYPMPFYPDSFKVPMALNLEKARETGKTITQEAFVLDLEGNELWYHSTIVPVKSDDGQIEYIMVISLEITERKLAEEELQRNLKEKEVLLREVHHRVKNNLQVINSLLRLQARRFDDERLTQALTDSQNRVNAMALLHQTLYGMADVARIDFAEYAGTLARELCRAYGVDTQRISIQVKAEDVTLSLGKASPCGLIVTELVSNSLKHAFPEGWDGQGQIEISLRALDEGIIEIVVSDNGIGMPEDLATASSRSLGLHLVTMLAEDQLDGAVEWRSENGARVQITFPGG
ncbi:MAG: PAS domain-containing protein [Verrucomicrobia bacterium]|jgi:PAS domain S-box-containing protein|nr:PAS domain-containing protein [Verrucomicrobiota bacterium]